MKTVKDYIRTIPDFPEKGIMFRDVTSVIQDADGLKLAIDEMIKRLDGLDFDVIEIVFLVFHNKRIIIVFVINTITKLCENNH